MWWVIPLLLAIIILVIALYRIRNRPDKYHVVVAKYLEDIDWVYEKYDPKLVKVYDKSNGDLPNIGRESHTYLTYIVDNYEKLPDVVIFTQGNISDHKYENFDFLNIEKYSKNLTKSNWNYYFYCPQLGWNNDHIYEWRNTHLTKDELGFTRWFREYIDSDADISKEITWWIGAIFSVRRECILLRPKEYYQRLLDYIPKTNAPEVAHYFERSWFYIVTKTETEIPRKVWILWLQGWENAPYLVQKVRESWEKHNPSYEVIQLSRDNIKEYIPDIQDQDEKSDQAYSDIIRLNLLEKHGGIWADATMLCMKPINSLINSINGDVWMYRAKEECKLLASWFIISKPNSYIIKKWKEKCDEYWKQRKQTDNYFWMDALWIELYNSDEKFKKIWSSVEPKICCEEPGQAHMFAGKVNSKDDDLQKLLLQNVPYAIKLSHHGYIENDQATNGNFAIILSLKN